MERTDTQLKADYEAAVARLGDCRRRGDAAGEKDAAASIEAVKRDWTENEARRRRDVLTDHTRVGAVAAQILRVAKRFGFDVELRVKPHREDGSPVDRLWMVEIRRRGAPDATRHGPWLLFVDQVHDELKSLPFVKSPRPHTGWWYDADEERELMAIEDGAPDSGADDDEDDPPRELTPRERELYYGRESAGWLVDVHVWDGPFEAERGQKTRGRPRS